MIDKLIRFYLHIHSIPLKELFAKFDTDTYEITTLHSLMLKMVWDFRHNAS